MKTTILLFCSNVFITSAWGFGTFTGFQLKILQEATTVALFTAFAILFLEEKWRGTTRFRLRC